ncbi:MAG: hypothetical protein ACM3PU_07805 [Gemmatimonadota bacterium]
MQHAIEIEKEDHSLGCATGKSRVAARWGRRDYDSAAAGGNRAFARPRRFASRSIGRSSALQGLSRHRSGLRAPHGADRALRRTAVAPTLVRTYSALRVDHEQEPAMYARKTPLAVAGLAATLLVNAVLLIAADRSLSAAGPVLSDNGPVLQLDPVVVIPSASARTAAASELSGGASL